MQVFNDWYEGDVDDSHVAKLLARHLEAIGRTIEHGERVAYPPMVAGFKSLGLTVGGVERMTFALVGELGMSLHGASDPRLLVSSVLTTGRCGVPA